MTGRGCKTFERRLDEFLDGSIGPGEHLDLERHCDACDTCRELLELARIAQPLTEASDLTRAVLERTSGTPCAAARARLCDFVDLRLESLDNTLVTAHLADCVDCDRVAVSLAFLKTDLPLLAERPVDARFLDQVLARTSRRRRFAAWSDWVNGWRTLTARPRFALEAAYAITALLVMILGIPSAPIAGVSRRAFEITAVDLRSGLERSVGQARTTVSSRAKEAGARISLDTQTKVDDVAELSTTVAEDIRHGVGTLWGRLASGQANADDNRSQEESDPGEGDER